MTELLTLAFDQFVLQLDKLESAATEEDSRALNLIGNFIYDSWAAIMCEHYQAHKRTTQGILTLRDQWRALNK